MPYNVLHLQDLSRLNKQLKSDSSISLQELQRRDHTIAQQLPTSSDLSLLKGWLEKLDSGNNVTRHRIPIEIAANLWLLVLGLICGAAVMAGLLLVGHQQVVNVLMFLLLFIGVQLLLLCLTAIAVIGLGSGYFHLPLELLNPIRLLFLRSSRTLTGSMRWENFQDLIRLALLRGGQWFGIAFNVSAAVTFLLILAATDRSFGWSSTFAISDQALARFVQTMSAPWHWLFAEAQVEYVVIEQSRFHALQTQFNAEQISQMRQWWPFLFASIVFYGLLPRAILWLVFQLLYRRQLAHSFVNFPGASLVLDRLKSPYIQTQVNAEFTPPINEPTHLQKTRPSGSMAILNWAGAARDKNKIAQVLNCEVSAIQDAGIDLSKDQFLVQEIQHGDAKAVVIAVKSWEPPLAELRDFIEQLPPTKDCHLLLISLDKKAVTQGELQDWQHFARQSGALLLQTESLQLNENS